MINPPTTVRLDPRRLEQLKAIAFAEGTSVTEAITGFIRSKIEAGVIAPTIPGMSIKAVPGGVAVNIGTGNEHTYKKESALAFAATARDVAQGGKSVVNLDHGFAVIRQGVGIRIAAPFPGTEISVPPSLAEDLADLIERSLSDKPL